MDCWPVQTALGFSPDISSDEHQWQQMDELTLTKLAIWLLGFISVYIQLKSYPIDTIFTQSLAEEPACVLTQRLLWKQTTMSIYTTQDRWKKITSLKRRLQSQGALTDTCLRIWGQQFSPKWSVQSSKISACMLTERHSASPLIQGFLVLHGSDFKGNEASSNLNTQLDFVSAIQLTLLIFHYCTLFPLLRSYICIPSLRSEANQFRSIPVHSSNCWFIICESPQGKYYFCNNNVCRDQIEQQSRINKSKTALCTFQPHQRLELKPVPLI